MHHHQHRFSLRGQRLGKAKNLLLIHHIKARRGLIQKDNRRLLSQHLGNQNALLLAAAYLGHRSLGQIRRAGVFHAGQRQPFILLAFALPPFHIRVAPRHHNILAGVAKAHLHMLLQIGNLCRQLLISICLQGLAKIANAAALLGQKAANRL